MVLTSTVAALIAILVALLLAHRRIQSLQCRLVGALHEANHDRLTGLPNRRAAHAHLADRPVAMTGLLDLDGFKDINDRHGHHVGDHLLAAIAASLTEALGRDGTVYRLAGDEFLLLWHHRPSDPVRTATTLLRRTMQPMTHEGHTLRPAGSLGLALSGPHLAGADLIVAADSAMYEAKIHDHSPNSTDDPSGGIHLYAHPYPPAPTDRRLPDRRANRSSPNRQGTISEHH